MIAQLWLVYSLIFLGENVSPLIKRGNGHLWMILSPKPRCTKAFPFPFGVCVCLRVSN